eukprot:363516-Chlamydomonas_euryale.AAC.2
MAGNTAAGPAAAARTAAAGNANLVDDGDVDDNDDLDLSESGEEEHPKASPFVEAARAPMHTPKPTPPLAGELSAAGLATPGGGLSEAGDYSVDGESYGSPTKTPGAESSVNFAAASGRQGGGGGGAAISVEDFGGGGSAAGAAARFKAMDDRRAAAAGRGPAEKPPVLPKLADVEAADLDYEDKEMGLELPSPLQLFLQYDTDRTGGINVHEFAQMLYDLDGLDDLQAKWVLAKRGAAGGGSGVAWGWLGGGSGVGGWGVPRGGWLRGGSWGGGGVGVDPSVERGEGAR